MTATTILTHYLTQSTILTGVCICAWSRASTAIAQRRADWMTLAAALAVPLNLAFQNAALALSAFRPLKLDHYAYALDALAGQPSFAIGKILQYWPALDQLLTVVYYSLPFAMLAALAVTIYGHGRDVATVIKANTLSFIALPVFYLLVPICGPVFAYSNFPQLPAANELIAVPIAAAPNAMPSGHFSGALLFAWAVWPFRRARAAGVAFAALMFLATLGLGQHYLIDLIMAVPYTLGVVWIAKRRWRRNSDES